VLIISIKKPIHAIISVLIKKIENDAYFSKKKDNFLGPLSYKLM